MYLAASSHFVPLPFRTSERKEICQRIINTPNQAMLSNKISSIFKRHRVVVQLLQKRGMVKWATSAQQLEIPNQCVISVACSDFVKSIGKGTLLPLPSIDYADNLQLFQLVIKSRKKWLYLFEKVEYRPTEFQITDVMMNNARLDVDTNWYEMVTDYDKTSKLALKGKVGTDIAKNILGVQLDVQDSVMIDVDFGTVWKKEVDQPKLMNELIGRRINLNHPYIRQIREDESKTLCVVTSVANLKHGGVIRKQSSTDLSATAKAQVIKKVDVTGGTGFSREREIVLPASLPIAYRVHELAVDEDCGHMELILATGMEGGFVSSIGCDVVIQRYVKPEIDERKIEEDFSSILMLPHTEREKLRETFQNLISIPRDLCIMADIIDVQLAKVHNIDEIQSQMLLADEKWMPLMLFSGFYLKDDCLFPPQVKTPLFLGVSQLLDNLSVLEDDVLELLPRWDKKNSRGLRKVLLSGMKRTPVKDRVLIESVLSDTVSVELLKVLKFDVQEEMIAPPADLPPTLDEIYVLLYVLWG